MRGASYLHQHKTSHKPAGRTMSQFAPVFKELTHDDLLKHHQVFCLEKKEIHRKGLQGLNVQPTGSVCVGLCVFRLEQCTHPNCKVCIKSEHVYICT